MTRGVRGEGIVVGITSGKTSAAIIGLAALALLALAPVALRAEQKGGEAVDWEGEQAQVREGSVGSFQGETLRFEVRTVYSSLTSSHVRVTLRWRDKWAKEDVEQVLFEDERYARNEDYTFTLDGKLATLSLAYPCPQDVKDRTTTCAERWEWQKNTRRFTLAETTSSNPLTRSSEEIEALIKKGKLKEAKAAVEVARERFGKEAVEADRLFAAFWGITLDEAIEAGKKDPSKGVAIIEAFLDEPPITSSERCPNKELIKVCLNKGQLTCGCSDPFGQVSGFEGKWPRRYGQLAKLLGKAKSLDLTIRLLEPAVENLPEDADVLLALADAYWDKDLKYKARPLYAKVRLTGLNEKKYVPDRVFDRYKDEAQAPQ